MTTYDGDAFFLFFTIFSIFRNLDFRFFDFPIFSKKYFLQKKYVVTVVVVRRRHFSTSLLSPRQCVYAEADIDTGQWFYVRARV
jgi:hypothetical protein